MTREEAYAQYEHEVALFEQWGQQNTTSFEEWIEIKGISITEPSLPSNLGDYARDSSLATAHQIEAYTNEPMTEYGFNLIREMLEEAIHRGAEWMAEQGETVDGFISIKGKRSLISVLSHLNDFKYGDKVIVQIRKK